MFTLKTRQRQVLPHQKNSTKKAVSRLFKLKMLKYRPPRSKPLFTYSFYGYENGVLGKCNEMPSISAQGKSGEEVAYLLKTMTRDYLKVVTEVRNRK